jgi:hypothetical protein
MVFSLFTTRRCQDSTRTHTPPLRAPVRGVDNGLGQRLGQRPMTGTMVQEQGWGVTQRRRQRLPAPRPNPATASTARGVETSK